MDVPGVVSVPESGAQAQRILIRQAQAQIIAEDPNTFFGAPTVQYGPESFTFEEGIGQIHYTPAVAGEIAETIATSIHTELVTFPQPLLKPDPAAYELIGQLWPDPASPNIRPVNAATMAFFERFFQLIHERDFKFVNSVAYEILNFFMPEEWKQRNFVGTPALSGWVPPSSFIQPTNQAALDYISAVQVQLLESAVAAGLEPKFQIGEPWWWDGSYSTGAERNAPCLYDAATMAMYEEETGRQVPTPRIESIFAPVNEDQWPYVDWLRVKLGESTNYIRDSVLEAFPTAQSTLLFFSPQVLSPSSDLTYRLNFPIEEWKYPSYDFVQIEDYDWIIEGRLDLVPRTFEAATELLNYPLPTVQYFVGFVLSPEEAQRIWPDISRAWALAREAKVPIIYPWSYTQVMRDNIIVQHPAS